MKEHGKKEGLFEFFDDCEICRIMKQAREQRRELTEEELLRAFAVQNEKNNRERS